MRRARERDGRWPAARRSRRRRDGPLEEQRRSAGLAGPVGDLGHLEVRVDGRRDHGQLALAAQQLDELAQAHRAASDLDRQPTSVASERRGRVRRAAAPASAQPERRRCAAHDLGQPLGALAHEQAADFVEGAQRRQGVAARRRRGDAGHAQRPEVVVVGERPAFGAQPRAARHEPREQLHGVEVAGPGDEAQAARVEVVAGQQPGRRRRVGARAGAADAVVRRGSPRRRTRAPAGRRRARVGGERGEQRRVDQRAGGRRRRRLRTAPPPPAAPRVWSSSSMAGQPSRSR